jgi:hypothetical protein
MQRSLFLRIMHEVCAYDSDFVQKCILELKSLQKYTAVFYMLAYGVSKDAVNEYCSLSDTTAMESMKRFVSRIMACFERTYLRQPTHKDIVWFMDINEERFLGHVWVY